MTKVLPRFEALQLKENASMLECLYEVTEYFSSCPVVFSKKIKKKKRPPPEQPNSQLRDTKNMKKKKTELPQPANE